MFKKYTAEELLESITSLDIRNNIDGTEIYIDMKSAEERKYCSNLVKIIKDNSWILQIHSVGMYKLSNEIIKEYLHYYNQLALVYGNKIKLTVHASENKDSIIEDRKVLNFIHEYIKQKEFNIEILIENLNKINEVKRCNIYDVYEIIDNANVDIDGITLDVGHYVYDYSNDYTTLYNHHTDRIKNIHIHDINNKVDHYPFYHNNVDLQKVANFLKDILYNESVVLEFGLEYLKGREFEEKIKEYIKQIEYVKSYIN